MREASRLFEEARRLFFMTCFRVNHGGMEKEPRILRPLGQCLSEMRQGIIDAAGPGERPSGGIVSKNIRPFLQFALSQPHRRFGQLAARRKIKRVSPRIVRCTGLPE